MEVEVLPSSVKGKNIKTTEPVKRMNGVCVDDENAVKVRKI